MKSFKSIIIITDLITYIKNKSNSYTYVIILIDFPQFGKYLNETGRPMIYSCCWPFYQEGKGMQVCIFR